MTRADRVRQLRREERRLERRLGRSPYCHELAAGLGVTRSYAAELRSDPDGEKTRRRKAGYRGVCVDCGGPTDGSGGPRKQAVRCQSCRTEYVHATQRWTEATIVDAIHRFAAEHGRPPTSTEWMCADRDRGYPPRTSVYRAGSRSSAPFARWSDAIVAAGFPRPRVGRRPRARA